MSDERPSIAELQRLANTGRCECDARPGDTICGVHLPPVLLEIVAAALTLRTQAKAAAKLRNMVREKYAPKDADYAAVDVADTKLVRLQAAYDAALAKVRP